MAADAVTVEAGGREVRITSPDKVFFKTRGDTKLDLVRYYQAVDASLMATIENRPTLMQRFPDGAHGKSFFQKRVPAGAPDWLTTTEVSTPNGTTSNALVIADLAHLLWAVNQGCLGFHPWPIHAATTGLTDELRIDLDPSPGVSFEQVREAALVTKEYLDEAGIASFVKTTGNRGLHIYVRVGGDWDSFAVRRAAITVARDLEERRPDLLTARWWKEERGERVFVDFNQNAPHKTVFGAWCVRPRVGGQVSCPISWDEVPTVDPERLTLDVVPAKLAAEGDPWATMNSAPQSIDSLVERFRAHLEAGGTDEPWPPVYPKMPDEPPRVAPSRAKTED